MALDFSVNIIDLPLEKKIYQSAFVYLLPPSLEKHVLRIRKKNDFIDGSQQLKPHLTLLFLGDHWGKDMLRIYQALQPLLQREIPFEITGKGFFVQNGSVTNAHFKVEPNRQLIRLHNDALRNYTREGFKPQTKYIRRMFNPHISIFNEINISPAIASKISCRMPGKNSGMLANPVFFIKEQRQY